MVWKPVLLKLFKTYKIIQIKTDIISLIFIFALQPETNILQTDMSMDEYVNWMKLREMPEEKKLELSNLAKGEEGYPPYSFFS